MSQAGNFICGLSLPHLLPLQRSPPASASNAILLNQLVQEERKLTFKQQQNEEGDVPAGRKDFFFLFLSRVEAAKSKYH